MSNRFCLFISQIHPLFVFPSPPPSSSKILLSRASSSSVQPGGADPSFSKFAFWPDLLRDGRVMSFQNCAEVIQATPQVLA